MLKEHRLLPLKGVHSHSSLYGVGMTQYLPLKTMRSLKKAGYFDAEILERKNQVKTFLLQTLISIRNLHLQRMAKDKRTGFW